MRNKKEGEKIIKAQIQEAIKKGRDRPLLIESSYGEKKSTNLAKIKALKEFVNIL